MFILSIRLSREIKTSACLVQIQFFVGETRLIFSRCTFGRFIRRPCPAKQYAPHAVPTRSKGIQGIRFGGRPRCRICRNVVRDDSQHPSGLHSMFPVGIFFHRLFRKAVEVYNQVFPSLDEQSPSTQKQLAILICLSGRKTGFVNKELNRVYIGVKMHLQDVWVVCLLIEEILRLLGHSSHFTIKRAVFIFSLRNESECCFVSTFQKLPGDQVICDRLYRINSREAFLT